MLDILNMPYLDEFVLLAGEQKFPLIRASLN